MRKTDITKKEAQKESSPVPTITLEKTEKEKLLDLYKVLKDMGINSIGDLEVKISRL